MSFNNVAKPKPFKSNKNKETAQWDSETIKTNVFNDPQNFKNHEIIPFYNHAINELTGRNPEVVDKNAIMFSLMQLDDCISILKERKRFFDIHQKRVQTNIDAELMAMNLKFKEIKRMENVNKDMQGFKPTYVNHDAILRLKLQIVEHEKKIKFWEMQKEFDFITLDVNNGMMAKANNNDLTNMMSSTITSLRNNGLSIMSKLKAMNILRMNEDVANLFDAHEFDDEAKSFELMEKN